MDWTVIGHQKRPEILLSPVFEAHLRKSRKLLQTYTEEFKIESFFDCILEELDPLMVGIGGNPSSTTRRG